jgi:Ca2+-binding RTX toxin-like protein
VTIAIEEDRNTQLLIRKSNENIQVFPEVILAVEGEDAMVEQAGVRDNLIEIAGGVKATGNGNVGILSRGLRTDVIIFDDGDDTAESVHVVGDIGIEMAGDDSRLQNGGGISGDSVGVRATGKNVFLVNNELIHAEGTGVDVRARSGITEIGNGGTIEGDIGVFVDGRAKITNSGRIEGGDIAIEFKSGPGKGSVIENASGKIVAGDGGIAIKFGAGNDKFQNGDGFVDGRILLGDGKDLFSADSGDFDKVEGGKGNDIYRMDVDGSIIEKANGGIDVVRSFGETYTLEANVENLVLLRLGDTDGFGNDGDNRITGNDFANVIGGLGGNDVLTGKGGEDTFRFFTGHGKDVITDFEAGVDALSFVSWEAIEDFADLIDNHTTVKGKDLVFKAGADSLTLKGVGLDEIAETDFNFVI